MSQVCTDAPEASDLFMAMLLMATYLDLVSLVLEAHCLTLSPHFLPQKPLIPTLFFFFVSLVKCVLTTACAFPRSTPLSMCVFVLTFLCVFFPQVATHYFPWPSGKPGRLWESNFGSLERDGTCSMHQIGK